mmetsp:Transcript_3805/g.5771  ORF Transcript_3805/g.5771 Transcript_3805/m.5771 type:complete len:245 (+) Transcript_3805:284-1018(+)
MNITRLCPGPAASKPCGTAQGGAGDFDVFVDTDGAGYLIYGANYWTSIEKLSEDFLSSTGLNATWENGPFGSTVSNDYFVEAPAMFKRGNTYYALFGHCCCYCLQGSGIIVHTSKSPMGPWVKQKTPDLACRDPVFLNSSLIFSGFAGSHLNAIPTPGQGCLYNNSNQISIVKSQQNFVIQVPNRNGSIQHIWTGDRWQQAPDGLKGHDPQVWVGLNFDEKGIALPVTWQNSISFEVPDPGDYV